MKPGPVVLIDIPYEGSVAFTATTTPDETAQIKHTLSTLLLVTTLPYSIYLLESVVF